MVFSEKEIYNEINLPDIVQPLLEWYWSNARVLPWRENKDPYRVWVSEIMLQQTRVDTVIPYYERFLIKLPDIRSLAQASEEVLLNLWAGLGYYSRVRNMQRAAQVICEQFDGVFPESFEEIAGLPGIGQYTAGAISSIAFEKPVPAVDGNVLRVFTRLTKDSREIHDPHLKKNITEDLTGIYPLEHCGDFTQSLMELGALICLPNKEPDCDACPLSHLCLANRTDTQMNYPVVMPKKQRISEEKTVLLMCHQGRIALQKRPDKGLLAGLWELPNLSEKKSQDEINVWLRERGIQHTDIERGVSKKHIFTHVEWHMTSYIVHCTNQPELFTWVTSEELERIYSLPTAFTKILSCHRELLTK